MASETRKPENRYIAFKIDSEIIDRVSELFARDNLQPSIVFKMSDKTEISTSSFDDLKKFPNTKERQINEFRASSPYSISPRIELSFRDAGEYGGEVTYVVTGEDRSVLHISSELDTIISAARMWWTPIVARSPYVKGAEGATQAALLVASVICLLLSLLPGMTETQTARLASLMRLFTGAFLIWLGINRIARFVYPAASFAIGNGTARFKMRENWRVLVVLALIIGVVGSLIGVRLEWLVK